MNELRTEINPEHVLEVVAAVAKEARPNVEPHVALDSSLEKELGLDSLARVELVLRLEKEFGASLPEQALATSETPHDMLCDSGYPSYMPGTWVREKKVLKLEEAVRRMTSDPADFFGIRDRGRLKRGLAGRSAW